MPNIIAPAITQRLNRELVGIAQSGRNYYSMMSGNIKILTTVLVGEIFFLDDLRGQDILHLLLLNNSERVNTGITFSLGLYKNVRLDGGNTPLNETIYTASSTLLQEEEQPQQNISFLNEGRPLSALGQQTIAQDANVTSTADAIFTLGLKIITKTGTPGPDTILSWSIGLNRT